MLRSNANNADPDQIPLQSAISELELHFLHLRNVLFFIIQTVLNLNICRILGHNFRIHIGRKAPALLLRATFMRCKYEGTKLAVRQIF